MKILCATLLLATVVSVFSATCTDYPNFYDADGDRCSYYNTNKNACYTAARNRQGISPLSACCGCGGGTQSGTTTSSASTTQSSGPAYTSSGYTSTSSSSGSTTR